MSRLNISCLLLITLFASGVSGALPSRDDVLRMHSDWKNTEKYKPVLYTTTEKEYFKSCSKKITYGDDYYQYDDGYSLLHPKAGETMARCTKKELRMLTRDELTAWAQAFRDWNTVVVDNTTGRTGLELFVLDHRYPRAEPAHYGPAFLVWHQLFLQQYEAALKKHNNAVCPCFWDSTFDQCLRDPSSSCLWSEDLMGTSHGPVVVGLFANQTIRPADCKKTATEPYIYRDVVKGTDGRYYLYSDPVIDGMFSRARNYSMLCYPQYPECEDNHGYVHMWVGGSMGPLACSPNEVLFWLHHENINRLFKDFIKINPMNADRRLYYPTWSNIPRAQQQNSTLKPFDEVYPGITCWSGLNTSYDTWDQYELPPYDCVTHTDCKSDYYWCMVCNGKRRCASKLKEGAPCGDYGDDAACYKPLKCAGKNMTCKDPGTGTKICMCT